jgi:hypothetical protein
MPKTDKVGEGVWRSADGLYEISEVGGAFLVNERRGNQWVTIATAKTKTAADKELTKLDKQEDEAPALTAEEVAEALPKEEG